MKTKIKIPKKIKGLGGIEIYRMPPEALRKAAKKGSREAELEFTTGFTSKHKVHKTVKTYTRKPKHKEKIW